MENIEKINNHNVRNKVIIAIVCILGLCTLLLTVYKYYYDKDFEYDYNELKKITKDMDKVSTEDYKDKIVEDNISYDYQFTIEDNTIFGNVYIGTDDKLYITNKKEDTFYKVSDIEFNTLFVKKEYPDGLYLYLISKENKLYLFSLDTTDIDNSIVEEIYTDFLVKSFVDIEYKNDNFEPINSIFVLSIDNVIYDAYSNVPYNPKTLCLDNKYLIYDDKTITDIEGYSFVDSNEYQYKIKYFFYVYEQGILMDSIIVTEDDRLIYIDEDNWYVVEVKQKIKNIEMKDKEKHEISNLKITFEDNLTRNYDASYGEYFAFLTK